jgi:lipopolysaccharide/colanic/teichoic acid biosynthesis glycosyltransferase
VTSAPGTADVRLGGRAVGLGSAAGGLASAGPGTRVGSARVAARAVLPVSDVAALAVVVVAMGTGWPDLVYAAGVYVVLASMGVQRLRICLRVSDQVGRLLAAVVVPLPLLLLFGQPSADALRLTVAAAGVLAGVRSAVSYGLLAGRRHGLFSERALVVGAGETGTLIASLLAEHPELGLRPVGFCDSGLPPAAPLPLLGQPAELAEAVREHRIGRVIVATPVGHDDGLVPVLRAARALPTDICVVPRLPGIGLTVPRACLDEVWGIPLLPLRRPSRAGLAAKRALDVAAALVLLAVLGLPLLVLGLVVRCQLRRPALFRQVRLTGPGGLAEILKLRTLTGHGDPDTSWAAPAGQSTRLGRFLRATHADELPQLLNVLRGQLSLVGPRPERPYFARRFEAEIPGYGDRHRVRAGLTGWAQVHGLNGDTSIADRAVFDNAYIENWSFWLDLSIAARTAAASLAAAIGHRGGQP